MMTSKGSLLNVALIKENFKRFWPIIAGSLGFWLICGPVALALTHTEEGYGYYVMESILRHVNPAPILLNILLPVAIALACFGYLHKTNSSGVMHAMPFSRAGLFVSNYVSGLIMAIIPVTVTTLFLLLMRGDVEIPVWMDEPVYFTGANILGFFIEEVTVISFVYAVAVFAAVISGLSVIHALTGVALNFICPAVFVLMLGFMDVYEYGFTMGSLVGDYALHMNPYMLVLNENGLTGVEIAAYLGIAAAIALLGLAVYKARHLERAGESYVFKPAKYIIGFLMVLFASSLTGFVFNGEIGILGYVFGFIVGYIVAMMIINKSTKIFTKECLTSGFVYALLIAAIVCVFRFDLIGYQTRVPQASKVESVTISSWAFDLGLDGEPDVIADPENIERVTNLHEAIVSDKSNYMLDRYYDSRVSTTSLTLRYSLKNGRTVQRFYTVPVSLLRDSADLRAIWDSGENTGLLRVLEQFAAIDTEIRIEGYGKFDEHGYRPPVTHVDYPQDYIPEAVADSLISADSEDYAMTAVAGESRYDMDVLPIGSARLADKEILLEALKKDVKNLSFESQFADYEYEPYINFSIEYMTPVGPNEKEEHSRGDSIWYYYDYNDSGQPVYKHCVVEINAREDYVNTMAALLQMNVSEDVRRCAESLLAQ